MIEQLTPTLLIETASAYGVGFVLGRVVVIALICALIVAGYQRLKGRSRDS
jgi:hypothetical protein